MRLGAPSQQSNTRQTVEGSARTASHPSARLADPTLIAFPSPAHSTPTAASTTAPTLFCWDGNRLLAEHRADTHQLYLYEPDSFVPLAIVRWKAANEGSSDDGNTGTPPPNTDDRPDLLPPELLSLKERYPEQWARIEAQRRKLARQLGQPPEPDHPKPHKAEVFHVHVDHLGTPREITDTDGHLVWTAHYAAWGKAVTANPPRRILGRAGNAVTETLEEQAHPLECNLRFQGQYADAESGLHYNRFRYYDSDIGRFSQHDQIRLVGGSNFYSYAPNPTAWIDPLGLTNATVSNGILCLVNKFPVGTTLSSEFDAFIGLWDETARSTPGGLTRRTMTPELTKEANAFRRRAKAQLRCCGLGDLAPGHLPDTAWGGLADPGDAWVPLEQLVNQYIGGLTQAVPAGTSYTSVRSVRSISDC